MDFNEFKEQFTEDVKQGLAEAGIEAKVSTNTVEKMNESYEAMTVTPEGSNVGVNVNMEKFFEAYENGTPYEDVVDKAVSVVEGGFANQPTVDVSALTDYDQMKDKLIMEVVSAEANADMLDKVPHKEMEDMAVVYRFELDSNDDGRATILVTNQLIETMGVTPEQLHADAMENAPELKPAVIKGMSEVMAEMMGVSTEDLAMMGMPMDGVATQQAYQSYESYQVEEEYEYYILNVTLTNHSIDYVARNMGLTAEQLQRYEILLETFGNKKYLFENDPYAAPQPGDYQDYRVPSEYLTDVEFGNMIHEAEKYLGYPYVWGGSSPSTSFDCSGFVSYVINNCGNGWNVGRQTANGLLNNCTRVSKNNAKPGDLIFFQGTYDTAGASHVGIYVGDGMMIHCGNPIQYANINSSYWQSHFYTFGRLNH